VSGEQQRILNISLTAPVAGSCDGVLKSYKGRTLFSHRIIMDFSLLFWLKVVKEVYVCLLCCTISTKFNCLYYNNSPITQFIVHSLYAQLDMQWELLVL